ncbi:MAG: T9SS type A sorting domain-containing protein [Candidatus Azobacteroides sp.]|nr:T9SS type A sorting domain-containing protein [Candidatus Azobacteroides sp.]
MKKLFFLLMGCLAFGSYSVAQEWGEGILSVPKRIWTEPVIYNYDEEVTWYFDLSDEPADIKAILDEATLALWTWVPSNPGDGHLGGGYGLAQPELMLTHRGGYVYSITMKPSVLYAVSNIESTTDSESFVMHIRVFSKDRDADINCAAFHIRFPHVLVQDIKTNGIPATVYPIPEGGSLPAANATTAIAILMNNEQVGANITGDLFVTSGINDWEKSVAYDEGNPERTKAKTYFGVDDVYVFNITNPSRFFDVNFDYPINTMEYQFKFAGAEEAVYEGDQEFEVVAPWTTGIKNTPAQPSNVKYTLINDVLTVDAASFSVFSITGVAVAQDKSGSLDMSGFPKGIYILKTGDGIVKFIK